MKSRNSATRKLLLLFAVGCLLGCGDSASSLSRSRAAELIKAMIRTSTSPETKLGIGNIETGVLTVDASKFDASKGLQGFYAAPIYGALASLGYLQIADVGTIRQPGFGGDSVYKKVSVSLTAKGQELANSGQGFTTDGSFIGPIVARMQFEGVTGIAYPEPGHALVDYTWRWALSPLGEQLVKTLPPGSLDGMGWPPSLQSQAARAHFMFYDDGWRVMR